MSNVYKILNKDDNRESSGGIGQYWCDKEGKIWRNLRAIKLHLSQFRVGSRTYDKDDYVVEYELVEKRRIPMGEFYPRIFKEEE